MTLDDTTKNTASSSMSSPDRRRPSLPAIPAHPYISLRKYKAEHIYSPAMKELGGSLRLRQWSINSILIIHQPAKQLFKLGVRIVLVDQISWDHFNIFALIDIGNHQAFDRPPPRIHEWTDSFSHPWCRESLTLSVLDFTADLLIFRTTIMLLMRRLVRSSCRLLQATGEAKP
jgi:hypothetical protein